MTDLAKAAIDRAVFVGTSWNYARQYQEALRNLYAECDRLREEVVNLRKALAVAGMDGERDRLRELLCEWLDLGNLPGGGYGGTLIQRTEAALGLATEGE